MIRKFTEVVEACYSQNKEELNEKIIGKIKPYESSLIGAYIKFLQDYFKISQQVNIILKKPDSKAMFGFIDLISMSNGKYDIVIKYQFTTMLGHIAHEFTHVKQFIKGELYYSDDLIYILWKNEKFISVKEMSKMMKDFSKYKELPWEKEAYKNQDDLPNKFKQSKHFKDLYIGADSTLTFVLDNL